MLLIYSAISAAINRLSSALSLRVSFAVINNSERRKEDENREKTTHRITFGALRRSLGARANSPAPHSLSSQKKTAVPQKNSRPVFSVDMSLKSGHKQVQEISTSLLVSPYRRIEPC